MGGQIFISYRREDSAASARRLYDRLSGRFASNQIFIDVDNLALGVDFVKAIEESVGSCDVLIAVIGGRWLISSDEEGRRRLDNPEDYVRLEIATALKRGIRVIPVLMEGGSMPRSCDLPDGLKSLVCRNAVEVSHDRFRADSERLIAAVEQVLLARQLAATVGVKAPAASDSASAKPFTPQPLPRTLPPKGSAEVPIKRKSKISAWVWFLALGVIASLAIIGSYTIYRSLHPPTVPQVVFGTLAVESDPAGALITLDEGSPTKAPYTFNNVKFGSHRLTAHLKGYLPIQQDLQFDATTPPKIVLKLQQSPPHEIAALSVQTEPAGAAILLDGKPPQAPLNTFTHVPFGTHELTATLDDYEPIKQDIEVRRGMTPQIHLQLKPIQEIAALSVQSEPAGAAILLDGKPPQAPLNTFTHVPFGTHELTATLDDYEPIKQNIQVRRGMAPEIHLQLKPSQEISTLSIQSEPPGAAILLDGKPPQAPPNIFTHVPFGTHQLTATFENYEPATLNIQVREGMPPEIHLKLRHGAIEVIGSSFGADTPMKSYDDSDKLPTFFPPRATDSVVLSFQFASKNWTLQNVAEHLDAALRNAGYWGKCSYYWLDDRHGPGFAIVTHIEHIQPDGKPVLDQRWGFDLPRYGQLTLVSMLKALINADPGRYRLLALVVCKEPLVEKETPMTTHQVQELNAGPKWLADSPLKTVIPTEDFHLIAYVYEFERKSRSDDPALMVSSNLTAEQHLRSTALYDDIEKYLSK